MAEQFYTILTNAGKAKIANALPTGKKINLVKMKIGDGNGKYYNPTESQTDLVHKVYECNITSVEVDANNPQWITITASIPSDIGGFSIREVGVFDDANSLIAIGKYPETYKPLAADGSTKELYIKMTLEVANASSVELQIDPTIILATKKDINVLTNSIEKVSSQLNDNVKNLENVKTDLSTNYAKKTDVNDLASNKAEKTEVQLLNTKVNSLASGSPKAVSTIAEMIDTTKNYVLTTDGKWYYYNGTSWVSGGVYQSTGIANGTIKREYLNTEVNSVLSIVEPQYTHSIDGHLNSNQLQGGRTKILGQAITEDCIIKKVRFPAYNTGQVKIMIIDKTSELNFKAENNIIVNAQIGLNEIDVNIEVKKGQYLGIFDATGILYISTDVTENYYVLVGELGGKDLTFKLMSDGYIMFSYKAYGLNSTILGRKYVEDKESDAQLSEIEDVVGINPIYYNDFRNANSFNSSGSLSYTRIVGPAFKKDGIIRKILLKTTGTGEIKIMIFNKTGDTLFSQKKYQKFTLANDGLIELDVEIDVLAGDFLGIYSSSVVLNTTSDIVGNGYYYLSGNTNVGVDYTFTDASGTGILCMAYLYDNLSSNIEKINNKINLKNCRPLYIQTPYLNSLNQPYHPSVVYFSSGWNGYNYWMSETPFPFGASPYRDRYENPCIHCSNDGINWTTPIGLVNPIDDLNESEISDNDYLSDSNLVYRKDLNRLECWYRITHVKDYNHTYILRKYSSDGINWSEREVIYDCIYGTNEMIRSHGVIFEDNKYKFLYTGWDTDKVKYGEWDGVSQWTFNNCNVSDNVDIWHLDFGKDTVNNNYYMIAYSKTGGVKYYKSSDKINWIFVKTLLTTGDDSTFWNSGLYRSCAVFNGIEWLVYFTAEKDKKIATLGLLKGDSLENLHLVDGGNNIENFVLNTDIIINGEIKFAGNFSLGFDGSNLYFRYLDGTRVILAHK